MKKYILGLFACLALTAFVSCGSDDEGPIHHDTTAEIESEGTYSGTFNVSWSDKQGAHEGSYAGTITMTATETAGISKVDIVCPEMQLTVNIPAANVWFAAKGFLFSVTGPASVNGTTTNLKIYGRSDDGIMLSTAFVVNVKVGRSTTSYMYRCEAAKVGG